MKKIFLLSLIIAVGLIFLLGCVKKVSEGVSAAEDNKGVAVTDENKIVDTKVEETKKEEVPATTTPNTCVPGWKCISSTMKAYLNEDCTWKSKSTCKLGCANNACIVGSVCTSGFKCMNDNTTGFQNEDCSWDQTVTCDLGCKNGACVKLVNITS